MSISKLQILNNDHYRLIFALALSLLALAPLFIQFELAPPRSQQHVTFKHSENSLHQDETPASIGKPAPNTDAKSINTPKILTQKTSKVQLFVRANKTKQVEFPDKTETEQKSDPIIDDLSSNPIEASSQLSGAQTKKLLQEDLLFSMSPYYPVAAREKGFEGITRLKLVVRSSGFLLRTTILESSGHSILDAEAIKATSTWQFKADKTLIGNREYIVNLEFLLNDVTP
jgi:TonB family protein